VRFEDGEILARGPNVMQGYWNHPEDTAEALRDGWLHTGDLVTQDEDGMLAFVTRRSEAIRRRGENISPQEVEEAVAQAPGVLECAAYGVPSDLTEEEVMVAVVADPRRPPPAAEDIARRCAELLPRFAVPRYIRFVAEIPRTDSQRTRREALRREGVTPDTWQKEAGAR
jgi:crotonobetaine/carnitine-CoA ligase